MPSDAIYKSYNGTIVKCEVLVDKFNSSKLVVTQFKAGSNTNTQPTSLEHEFQGKCSVLSAEEIEYDGFNQLAIEIKERLANRNNYEYHTLLFNDVKSALSSIHALCLNCDIGPDNTLITSGPVIYFAYDAKLVVIDVRINFVSVLKAAFERKVLMLCTTIKEKLTNEVTLLAMTEHSSDCSTPSGLGELSTYTVKELPKEQGKRTCMKCQASDYIADTYLTMATALCVQKCNRLIVTSTFQQVLLFEQGCLLKCAHLELSGQITKILEFENQDNRRIIVLKSNNNEVTLLDSVSLEV